MNLRDFSDKTQDGLRRWALAAHGDELLFDDNATAPEFWSWIYFQLRVAADRSEWFPRGKWATLQVIEESLSTEARYLQCSNK